MPKYFRHVLPTSRNESRVATLDLDTKLLAKLILHHPRYVLIFRDFCTVFAQHPCQIALECVIDHVAYDSETKAQS